MNSKLNGPTTNPIYLDYQATTPTDPRVLEAMWPYFHEKFGNPHSGHHRFGARASTAVEEARDQVASLVGADPGEVIFTSGATEANNLVFTGLIEHLRKKGKNHILVLETEHKSVLVPALDLKRHGFAVTTLEVKPDGRLDLDRLVAALTPETGLVSIMAANNEIGVIQPVAEVGGLCRERNIIFHSDAAQAVGKIPVDVEGMNIDLMSISSHKLYGPMGVGALFIRGRSRIKITPLSLGGGQERGIRSGTLATPLCVGFGQACVIAAQESVAEAARLTALRDLFLSQIHKSLDGVAVNGTMDHRLPGNLNLSFEGVDAEALIMCLKDSVALSSGSACTSSSLDPSHVLLGIGLSESQAESSIRVSFGRFTTEDEIIRAANEIARNVSQMRRLYRSTIGS